jgi:ornithine cyclodeaminase/alanine dehydrogenase-like protein (mu-crystallin family)
MRLLDEHDVDALASVELGLTAARRAAAMVGNGSVTTGRAQVANETTWMRVLVGMVPELDLIGFKEFHRVGKRVRYHVLLFRESTGDPLGIVDGRRITSLRTASTAATAVAAAMGETPFELALIGSGEEAREGVRAVVGGARVDAVRVYSPTPANREALAREIAEDLGTPARPVAAVDEALDGAQVAYVATGSQQPFLAASQVGHLRMLAAIGATRPEHHELHGDVIATAPLTVVDCADALHEPGDVIDAIAAGWDPARALMLGAYLSTPPVTIDGGPVVFKSIGSVEQDLVLAHELLVAAEAAGRGVELEPVASLREMR